MITPEAPWLDAWLALPLPLRYALALVIAPAAVAVVGMGLEVCMRRTYGKDPLYGLLLTFGAALVLEEAIRLIWGPLEQIMPVPDQVSGGFIAGGLIWSTYRFFAVALALAVILLVWLFLEKTPYGAMIKAGAHDAEMVQALGINLVRLRLFVFALGTALAAIAGIIMTPIWGLRPTVGIDAVIPAFLIIVLGRRRQLLGGGDRRGPGRPRGRPDRRLRLEVVAALDVSPADRGRDLPGARPARQEERAGGLRWPAPAFGRVAARNPRAGPWNPAVEEPGC